MKETVIKSIGGLLLFVGIIVLFGLNFVPVSGPLYLVEFQVLYEYWHLIVVGYIAIGIGSFLLLRSRE